MSNYDISHWLDTKLGPIDRTNQHNVLFVQCPFCEDTRTHLSVSTYKRVFNCFRCGASGTHIQLIQRVDICTATEAYKKLTRPLSIDETPIYTRLGAIIEEAEKEINPDVIIAEKESDRTYNHFLMPYWYKTLSLNYVTPITFNILKYTMKRMNPDLLRHFGYCNDPESKFYNRLIIPIELDYFQARTIVKDKKPKYTNPDQHLGSMMYNAEALHLYPEIIICEGVFDAIASGHNAVGVLKSAPSEEQMDRILRSGTVERIIWSPDADKVHHHRTSEVARYFRNNGLEVQMRVYESGDPDDGGNYNDENYGLSHEIKSMWS